MRTERERERERERKYVTSLLHYYNREGIICHLNLHTIACVRVILSGYEITPDVSLVSQQCRRPPEWQLLLHNLSSYQACWSVYHNTYTGEGEVITPG